MTRESSKTRDDRSFRSNSAMKVDVILSKNVRLDLDETQTDGPLLEQFGSFSDDPTFDDWLEEIAAYRQGRNQSPESPRQ
jgi:hypothetical protein